MRARLLALFCLAALCCTAQVSQDLKEEQELLALERVAKLQACESKDLTTLDNMLDEGFLYVDPSGKHYTKAEFFTLVKSVDSFQYATDAMAVRLHGNTAIVTGLFQIKIVLHGQPSLGRGRFVDTWLLENGTWKGVASIDVSTQ